MYDPIQLDHANRLLKVEETKAEASLLQAQALHSIAEALATLVEILRQKGVAGV